MTSDAAPSIDGWLQATLRALLADHGGTITSFGPDLVEVALPGRRHVAVFPVRHPGDDDDVGAASRAARIAEQVAKKGPKAKSLIVVGGDAPAARAMLKASVPFFRWGPPIERFHVDTSGKTWSRGRGLVSPVVSALRAAKRSGPAPGIPWPAWFAGLAPLEAERRATVASMKKFQSGLAKTTPFATIAMLVCVVALFLLELALSATTSIPVLVHMGANVGEKVKDGEVWRLASSMFLHGSLLHAALNGWVLLQLGLFVERLLGTARFVVLFGVAGVAGSALSAFAGQAPVSVGASGALWGLLGAAGALAFRPQGLVPDLVKQSLRRAAFVNLGLNLFISFLPNIDVLAHAGGGLAGALLVGGGLLVVGLREDDHRPSFDATIRFTAVVVALALLGSIALALGLGRPWALRRVPETHEVTAEAAGIAFPAPTILGAPRPFARPDGLAAVQVGEPLLDPVALFVAVEARPGGVDDEEWRAVLASARGGAPPGATTLSPLTEIDVDGRRGARATWALRDGTELERLVVELPGHLAVVEALRWRDGFPSWAGVPLRAAGGLRVLAPAPPP